MLKETRPDEMLREVVPLQFQNPGKVADIVIEDIASGSKLV